jgi:hypothetical protein
MRVALPSSVLSGLMLWGLFGAGLPSNLAAAEPGSSDDGESPAYRKAIKEGVVEYEARRFEEARSLFRRAHQISPNGRTFRGMGMAAFELRDYVSAVRNLSAALRDSRKPLSEEQRKQTQELLDRSGLFVDVYTLKVTPSHARLIVDGHAPEFEHDGSLLFAFGRHAIEISAPAMEAQTLALNVRGGETKTFNVVLKRSEPEPQKESGASRLLRQKSTSSAPSNGSAKLLIGAGIATALLAGGAGVSWWKEDAELQSCRRPDEGQRCTNEGSIRTWRNVAMGTTIGVGAVAASLTVWGILTWNSTPSPSATIGPSVVTCVPGPLALTCVGRF